MSPRIIDCEQGTPEWFAARAGLVTASEFKTIVGLKKEAKDKATRTKYMRKLAGEILTGEVVEGFKNAHMERGNALEQEARDEYAFDANVDLVRIGFARNDKAGASPDSLIGADGVLEIKTALPDILIEKIEIDDFPAEHRFQCQGNLWVLEREWIDIKVYWPKMPSFVKRAYRDEALIRQIEEAVDQFNAELHDLVERMRRYGEPTKVAA